MKSAFRGFAGLLVVASIAAAAAVGLNATANWARVAAVILAVAVVALGARILASRAVTRLFPAMGIAAVGLAGLFAWHLYASAPPLPMRALHVGALLAFGAAAVAAALRILNIADEGRALLLACSVALPLFIADLMMPAPVVATPVRWQVNGTQDPQVGFRYAPNSTARTFYPDDPRKYFEHADPRRTSWDLETHHGSTGQLKHAADAVGTIRVEDLKVVTRVAWHVKLQQGPYRVEAGRKYIVSLRARADGPRRISCALGQNHEPWELLGPYMWLDLTTDWKTFEFPVIATASDTKARLFFDLAESEVPLDVADVAVRDAETHETLAPDVREEFFVTYRFNSLGFRGRDYAIPAPPETFRILALGDSYTLGVGVHEQDTFTSQLERRLNAPRAAVGAKTYEVINGGASGYSTRQAELSYELFSSKYRPQVVLLTMVFNDDLSFQDEERLGYLSPSAGKMARLSPLWARATRLKQTDRPHDYTPSVRSLLQINEAARQRDAKLAVVIFRNTEGFEPWRQLIDAVNEGVAGTGIPVIDLGPAVLKGTGREEELMVHAIDGHPNEIAHRRAAEEIERFLRSQGLLPR